MENRPSWLRPFGRSHSATNLITVRRNTDPNQGRPDPDAPGNASQPPTPTDSSPPRTRSRPSAAVRRVQSFLHLGGGGSGAAGGTDKSTSASATTPREDEHSHISSFLRRNRSRVSSLSSGAPSAVLPIRTPPPLAMLPLTEPDPADLASEKGMAIGRGTAMAGREDGAGSTWHNPNLMQMVETLRVVMMQKRDALVAIPIEYNSCVLALLEGFGRITRQLRDTEEQLAELKYIRERELEQFRGISEEWVQHEEAYKAEIKRLELLLAKESKDGVASVALARHESLVDRSGSKRFQAKVKRLSNPQGLAGIIGERSASRSGAEAEGRSESYRAQGERIGLKLYLHY
ncbi:hypothetical protein VTK56DRAFT_7120 [Thermocarpiscus australiensis]